jgi:hypothetical protein
LSGANGLAAILRRMFSQLNSLERGIGPMMPKLLRVGIRNTGIAPVMMMACRMDLWQLRSTTTMSSGATVECQTILFEVEVPLVTKNRWSQLKMRAGVALRSRHRTGMVEQLPEFLDGVADIGAQHVLAEELVEHLSDRTTSGRPRRPSGRGSARNRSRRRRNGSARGRTAAAD